MSFAKQIIHYFYNEALSDRMFVDSESLCISTPKHFWNTIYGIIDKNFHKFLGIC